MNLALPNTPARCNNAVIPPTMKPVRLAQFNTRNLTAVIAMSCLLLISSFAQASFPAREKRWATQIQETLLIGDAVWLKDAKGKDFFSIYTEASNGKPQGAVLILHGLGMHPDWPEVISPVRRALPEQGWTSLSLQMPILPAGAPLTAFGPIFDETPARIRAGIDFLHAKGIKHIVLLGHDMGAAMGAAFIVKESPPDIDAFIGIAMDAPTLNSTFKKIDPRLNTTDLLGQLKLPVLDLYGGLDIKRITNLAPSRVANARKAGNTNFKQVRVPDADHFFTNHDKDLVRAITPWLDKLEAAH